MIQLIQNFKGLQSGEKSWLSNKSDVTDNSFSKRLIQAFQGKAGSYSESRESDEDMVLQQNPEAEHEKGLKAPADNRSGENDQQMWPGLTGLKEEELFTGLERDRIGIHQKADAVKGEEGEKLQPGELPENSDAETSKADLTEEDILIWEKLKENVRQGQGGRPSGLIQNNQENGTGKSEGPDGHEQQRPVSTDMPVGKQETGAGTGTGIGIEDADKGRLEFAGPGTSQESAGQAGQSSSETPLQSLLRGTSDGDGQEVINSDEQKTNAPKSATDQKDSKEQRSRLPLQERAELTLNGGRSERPVMASITHAEENGIKEFNPESGQKISETDQLMAKEHQGKVDTDESAAARVAQPIVRQVTENKMVNRILQTIRQELQNTQLNAQGWKSHQFTFDDGSKIQMSVRQIEGLLQLQLGSGNSEMNRLLQQHTSEIRDYIEKEMGLDVELLFDGRDSGSAFLNPETDRNPGRQQGSGASREHGLDPEMEELTRDKLTVRNFGFNHNEWTA